MRVLWEEQALADLEEIADRAPRAAAHVYERVRWLADAAFPHAFRRLADDRDEHVLSVRPYIVLYAVEGDELIVLGIDDARRRER